MLTLRGRRSSEPVPRASGRTPSMAASVVMTMGRKISGGRLSRHLKTGADNIHTPTMNLKHAACLAPGRDGHANGSVDGGFHLRRTECSA